MHQSPKSTVREVQKAAPTIGLQIQIFNATTIGEIDAAFAALARERPDALFVAGDALFGSRRVQLATLTARDIIPAIYAIREPVAAGGLMSYGTDLAELFRQMGVYCGSIVKGAKPADLPVLQSTKFEFVINLTTAKALGLTIPGWRAFHRRRGDRMSATQCPLLAQSGHAELHCTCPLLGVRADMTFCTANVCF